MEEAGEVVEVGGRRRARRGCAGGLEVVDQTLARGIDKWRGSAGLGFNGGDGGGDDVGGRS